MNRLKSKSKLQLSGRFLMFSGLLLFLLQLIPSKGMAQHKPTKKDLEAKKSKLKEEINDINNLLHETRNSKKLSMGTVAILNSKLKAREELIATINSEIRLINSQISENQKQIDGLKTNLEKLKQEYARMIYYTYRNKDSYSKLMFLFASEDFNQAYQRFKYFQQYNEYRKKQAGAIVETQQQISEKNKELLAKKEDKKSLLSSEEQEKLSLNKEKEEQEQVIVKLQDTEKQLKGELEQKKRDAQALNTAIKKLIQEEIRRQEEERERERERQKQLAHNKPKKEEHANDTKSKGNNKDKEPAKEEKPTLVLELTKEAEQLSTDFAANKGKLPWPVVKGIITDGFGEHEHATIKGFIVNNNGVDISTGRGSAARAVFAGEVTGVASVPGAGKIVIVRHGEYLSVYSNLNEVFVKTGDKISVKQNLGTISHNEEEGKTTMNLQIWKGQKILNPEEWLYK